MILLNKIFGAATEEEGFWFHEKGGLEAENVLLCTLVKRCKSFFPNRSSIGLLFSFSFFLRDSLIHDFGKWGWV